MFLRVWLRGVWTCGRVRVVGCLFLARARLCECARAFARCWSKVRYASKPTCCGQLASLAATISSVFCVRVFCSACCRTLLDNVKQYENIAFKHVYTYAHARLADQHIGDNIQVGLPQFSSCVASTVFATSAAVYYWTKLSRVKT